MKKNVFFVLSSRLSSRLSRAKDEVKALDHDIAEAARQILSATRHGHTVAYFGSAARGRSDDLGAWDMAKWLFRGGPGDIDLALVVPNDKPASTVGLEMFPTAMQLANRGFSWTGIYAFEQVASGIRSGAIPKNLGRFRVHVNVITEADFERFIQDKPHVVFDR
ncbi:MAG: hypothetical protein KC503_12640 [Myxococcales bacterium]|nr:hypothetical protein [Myxococcales bacterium]